jgi:D-alanyl-D-alanine carboxypeptidase/D-alanyl-D-alanine-endopeptidase (penicillin-binding protein 4)
MAERSSMPLYGNVVRFTFNGNEYNSVPVYFNLRTGALPSNKYRIKRNLESNDFLLVESAQANNSFVVPFVSNATTVMALLADTLNRNVYLDLTRKLTKNAKAIYSQATDSMLKPMMHRSDNFFAEQTLMMVSLKLLNEMNEARLIDTLLKTDLKDLPQRPRWADGSGLSRYNLFTPQDFVFLLNKMKNEFGMERVKEIFPTGGEGTLSSFYRSESGYVYAKTGTLSGVVALSGFLYTKKNKLLLFSVLVNNHRSSATDIRRAVEQFLRTIRDKY